MRRPFAQYTADEDDSTIDLTPMLDVVFIMLIFFIVSASFVKESGIDVNKPEAVSTQQKDTASLLIAIDENNQIWINKNKVELGSLKANILRMHAENPQGTLVIQADKQSMNETLVQVMDAARQAGISNMAIAANSPEG